ncbi:hypothetical protein [Crocosphaera sp. Alani8]|uniref:hypothetical protein n=1 Tax=Crocosphaera sp. Alani8 TaxID=3038952 RepID=UPI00313C79A4
MSKNTSTLYLICPGFHEKKVTDSFVETITNYFPHLDNLLIFPTLEYPPYSGFHLVEYLQEKCQKKTQKLMFIAFSAGVVAAVTAAWQWQLQGGKIKGLIAFDGWGVPLLGNFPIYRISHDEFTHYSSAILGKGDLSFYADPAVDHLGLWRSPDQVKGWMSEASGRDQTFLSPLSLMEFLDKVL